MGDPSLELWKSEASQHKLREEGQLQVLQASEWSQDALMCPEKYLKSVDICCKRPTCSLSSLKTCFHLFSKMGNQKWIISCWDSQNDELHDTFLNGGYSRIEGCSGSACCCWFVDVPPSNTHVSKEKEMIEKWDDLRKNDFFPKQLGFIPLTEGFGWQVG